MEGNSRPSYFMKKNIVLAAIFIFMVVLFAPSLSHAASSLSTPTLLAPDSGENFIIRKPAIRGLTFNDTRVAVYIDDVFNGYAQVQNGSEGTASFVYFPFVDLTSGWHAVKVRAEDSETGVRSNVSGELSFFIEQPYPAPQVHYTTQNGNTTWSKPYICGIAKNDSTVQIFIDGALNGEFRVMNSGTGTASFSYKPYLALSPGQHTISAIAISPQGKKSIASESFTFSIVRPEIATVSSSVVSEAEETETEDTVLETVEEALSEEEADSATPEASQESEEEPKMTSIKEPESPDEGEEAASTEEAVEEDEEKSEDEKGNSSTIGWVLLALIAAALVWRNRKGFASIMKNKQADVVDTQTKDDAESKSVEVLPKGEPKKKEPEQKSSEKPEKDKDQEQKSLDI